MVNLVCAHCVHWSNYSRVQVTFDVFAALMDLFTSLRRNIAAAAPFLSADEVLCAASLTLPLYRTCPQVESLMDLWVDAYGNRAGDSFTRSETGTLQPFAYVARDGLIAATRKMGLEGQIPTDGAVFTALLGTAWRALIPWNGTADVLQRVVAAGMLVAPLSNGDTPTLRAATSIFAPQVGVYVYMYREGRRGRDDTRR